MKKHVHGVKTKPTVEPLDWECETCIFYADAERDHRESSRFILDALPCQGCDKPIMAEASPVGIALVGHTWQNELCEISWRAACDATDGRIPPEFV